MAPLSDAVIRMRPVFSEDSIPINNAQALR